MGKMKGTFAGLVLFILIQGCGSETMEKKTYYLWIQKADYESANYKCSSMEEVISLYNSYDWQSQFDLYDEDNNSLNCPPGFGIHDGNPDGSNFKYLLHICPVDSETLFFNFHYPEEKSVFLIFKKTEKKIHYANPVSASKAEILIRLFYRGKYDKIQKY